MVYSDPSLQRMRHLDFRLERVARASEPSYIYSGQSSLIALLLSQLNTAIYRCESHLYFQAVLPKLLLHFWKEDMLSGGPPAHLWCHWDQCTPMTLECRVLLPVYLHLFTANHCVSGSEWPHHTYQKEFGCLQHPRSLTLSSLAVFFILCWATSVNVVNWWA